VTSGRGKKERLDVLLVERGLAETRSRARALIMAGKVVVDERRRDKAGDRVPVDATIVIKGDDGWASRGAYKLLGALEAFPWLGERLLGAHCLDIGASTGGFTDVLLRRGAASVVAVDVGYGQLHWRLRTDPRVIVLDRTNVRHLPAGALPRAPTVATCDASFISVRKFLDVVWRELAPGGVFICLVKPQFEVGRDQVGKGGVVRDDALRRAALEDVCAAAQALGFERRGHVASPVAGPDGNREWLLVLGKPGEAGATA
jgi:23S rRNA (cytidine1920-2'-O)/16S rRNA (cytidine1409-2'-O)-methyltransferase